MFGISASSIGIKSGLRGFTIGFISGRCISDIGCVTCRYRPDMSYNKSASYRHLTVPISCRYRADIGRRGCWLSRCTVPLGFGPGRQMSIVLTNWSRSSVIRVGHWHLAASHRCEVTSPGSVAHIAWHAYTTVTDNLNSVHHWPGTGGGSRGNLNCHGSS